MVLLRFPGIDTLSDDFKTLFANKGSCGGTLQLQVMDKAFKAHKSVLMARSSVLSAKFEHDSKKRGTFKTFPTVILNISTNSWSTFTVINWKAFHSQAFFI